MTDQERLDELTAVAADGYDAGGGTSNELTYPAAVAFLCARGALLVDARRLARHWFKNVWITGTAEYSRKRKQSGAPSPDETAKRNLMTMFHTDWPTDTVEHGGCSVTAMTTQGGKIIEEYVCPCECRECKRRWFEHGQPIIRNGRIVTRHVTRD